MANVAMVLLAVTLAGAGTIETETEAPYDNDLYILSHIISAESGNCDREMMIAVGSVVLNRVADDRFPDSIEEVVFQDNPTVQYSPTVNGSYYDDPTDEAVDVAKELLETGSQIPAEVVWQAEFPQGTATWDTIESPWGTVMYFCY